MGEGWEGGGEKGRREESGGGMEMGAVMKEGRWITKITKRHKKEIDRSTRNEYHTIVAFN